MEKALESRNKHLLRKGKSSTEYDILKRQLNRIKTFELKPTLK